MITIKILTHRALKMKTEDIDMLIELDTIADATLLHHPFDGKNDKTKNAKMHEIQIELLKSLPTINLQNM